MKSTKYLVVYERGEKGFGASVPDLPGCVATADSLGEVKKLIRTAIQIHLDALRRDNLPIPKASSKSEYLELAG